MKHALVSVFAALVAFVCHAAVTSSNWIGPDGGNWNDPDNWSNGLPYFNSSDDCKAAQFQNHAGGADIHVVIDQDTKIAGMTVAAASGHDASNPTARIIFQGTHALTLEYAIDVLSGRELVIDGPAVICVNARPAKAKLTVRSGSLKATSSIYGGDSGGIFTQEGGLVETVTLNQYSGSKILNVRQTGGTMRVNGWTKVTGDPSIQNGTFQQTGGEFIVKDALSIDDRSGDKTTHTLSNQSFEFGGTVMVTNVASGRFFFCGDHLSLLGGGTYVAPEVWLVQPTTVTAANPDELIWDAGALYLSRYIQGATGYPHNIRFPRRVTLGGFACPGSATATGDWIVKGNSLSLFFEKGITFDTTDYWDKTSPRSIELSRAVLPDGAEVAVTGNGSASLAVIGNKPYFSKIDIGAGATYHVKGQTRTERLDIGAGGKIVVSGSNRLEVDEEGACTVAANATFAVTVPSDLKGNTYIIYMTASSSSTLAGRFVIEGDANGYALRTVGGCVYLEKAGRSPATPPATWQGWCGTVSSLVSDPANWSDGIVPYGTAKTVVLQDTLNPILTNDFNTVSNLAWSVVRFRGDAELPFLVAGEPVKVNGGALIHPNGQFYAAYNAPLYMDADASSSLTSASAISVADSFVLFSKTLTLTSLYALGDIRVSGTLTCSDVYLCDGSVDATDKAHKISHTRPTTLTVCRGGSATLSSVTYSAPVGEKELAGGKNPAGSYRVNEGGTLTMSFGTLGWTDCVSTNRIDGTFVLAAALGGNSEICFSGKGTIDLVGAALGASSTQSVRIVAGSTLTADFRSEGSFASPWTVEPGATLAVSPYGEVFTLTRPIAGAGAVTFAADTRLAVGGDLAATIEAAGATWTTLANIGAGATAPSLIGAYQTRVTATGELQARIRFGMLLMLR